LSQSLIFAGFLRSMNFCIGIFFFTENFPGNFFVRHFPKRYESLCAKRLARVLRYAFTGTPVRDRNLLCENPTRRPRDFLQSREDPSAETVDSYSDSPRLYLIPEPVRPVSVNAVISIRTIAVSEYRREGFIQFPIFITRQSRYYPSLSFL